MKQLFGVLKAIWQHPLSKNMRFYKIRRFVNWQIARRLHNFPSIVPFVNNTHLIIESHDHAATGNFYLGLMEFESMGFILHYLRRDDLFCDIGANIGAFTVLASGVSGAKSFSFEPVPETFEKFVANISVNQGVEGLIRCFNLGIGSEEGELIFTSSKGANNHVCLSDTNLETVNCAVKTLENVFPSSCPTVLKIDVEGFESNVIEGAGKILIDPSLNVIIMELCGNGKRYGFDEQTLFEKLLDLGFSPYHYNPYLRDFSIIPSYTKGDFIFIRDLEKARRRVKTASPFKIRNLAI